MKQRIAGFLNFAKAPKQCRNVEIFNAGMQISAARE
jgi:hypothetical protein